MGKAEMGYGLNRPSGRSLFGRGYQFTPDLDAMMGVPIQFWSTKPFVARWDVAVPQATKWFDFDLHRSGPEALEGKLINRLPLTLRGAFLLYNKSAYPLGDIAAAGKPGAEVTIDSGSRRNLQSEFSASVQYNQWTTEVSQILPRIMFYQALDPSPEQQRVNSQQDFVDLSPQLQMGRAILMADVREPALDLVLDGEPAPSADSRRWTYYRFVIPIEEAHP
jgi:hypothetical protein